MARETLLKTISMGAKTPEIKKRDNSTQNTVGTSGDVSPMGRVRR